MSDTQKSELPEEVRDKIRKHVHSRFPADNSIDLLLIEFAEWAWQEASPSSSQPEGKEELIEALREAVIQIDYLHKRFTEYGRGTGSGNSVIARCKAIIEKHERPTEQSSESEKREGESVKCPTCGADCTVSWAGLDLVEETGDETLATKQYRCIKGNQP